MRTPPLVMGAALAVAVQSVLLPAVRGEILSSKRGFADVGANYGNLQATGAGWYYTWGLGAGNPGGFDAKHAPMFWDGWAVNQNNISAVRNNPDVEWVMGFNEPERSDQANMSVADALAAWTTLSNGFAGSGKKLVSPAVSDTSDGKAWMTDFKNQATAAGLQVDAVAFHWYGWSTPSDPAQAAANFMGSVNWYHNLWNKPVFITEFAIHDWGGAYSDAEIAEANRQFLDIVIPQLESLSWVEGYAWYHWFGDAHLYEDSPPKPTPMAYEYVGALRDGDVEDIGGRTLGEHVAYLAGGELAMTGAPGVVRYINALEGVSTISGTVDYDLTTGNWVRVQPGATLRKAGTNHVTFRGAVTNHGAMQIDQGTLELASSVSGAGDLLVRGGTLKLFGRASIAQTPLIDVQSGGTFDVSEYRLGLANGQTLRTASGGAVAGDVAAFNGATVAGAGAFSGDVTAGAGALVRVGGAGLPAANAQAKIDDFEGYAPGKLNAGATGGVWTGVFDGTANAQVVSDGSNNSLEYYGTGSSWRGARTSLRNSLASDYSLADGDTATYFFRVQRQGMQPIDGIFGLTDLESIGIDSPWQELAITMSLYQDSGGPTALRALDHNDGGDIVVLSNVASDQWINVWLLVDNQNKTYQVATSADRDDGTLFPNVFNFGRRSAAGQDLDTFAGAEYRSGSNPGNASVRIDDLHYLAGVDLTNPLNVAGLAGETLTIAGDLVLEAGSTISFDAFDSAVADRVDVSGSLNAAGTLQVVLDARAPGMQLGDALDLFDFAAATGLFDAFDLPGLSAGLAWNVSPLATTGEIAVVEDVDLNDDGAVDGGDYLLIQQSQPSLLASWQLLYGSQLVTPTTASAANVPEPATVWLLGACGAFGWSSCRRRRRRRTVRR